MKHFYHAKLSIFHGWATATTTTARHPYTPGIAVHCTRKPFKPVTRPLNKHLKRLALWVEVGDKMYSGEIFMKPGFQTDMDIQQDGQKWK